MPFSSQTLSLFTIVTRLMTQELLEYPRNRTVPLE
jgi:hypothetical protein